MYTWKQIPQRNLHHSLLKESTHSSIEYILYWMDILWQRLSQQLFIEEDDFISKHHHSKMRILETLSDNDLFILSKDKRREWDTKVADYFDREMNHRSNPNRYEKEDLNKLKEMIDILDVVEHYCWQVKYRKWHLIKCPMPDHQDSTASMIVNKEKNFFKCFGCNAGWSAIDFIQKMEKCDLHTAITKFKSFA